MLSTQALLSWFNNCCRKSDIKSRIILNNTKRYLNSHNNPNSNKTDANTNKTTPSGPIYSSFPGDPRIKILSDVSTIKEGIVRARYAPSPTGELHLGGLRTALYNYLLVKQSNHKSSKFIVRIEDTDQTRLVEGAKENLMKSLSWAGIDSDENYVSDKVYSTSTVIDEKDKENVIANRISPSIAPSQRTYGPYIQSQRLPLYKHYAHKLVKEGFAYPCFCSEERLESIRKTAQKLGQAYTFYDRLCSPGTPEQHLKSISDANNDKRPYTIRMRIPIGTTVVKDLIRGQISYENKVIDDQILLKSDGFPTYHLAVVVDDYLMNITHVIRGEEWLSSTPKHILLYKMLQFPIPIFAHLPLLLKPDGSKLSKRHADSSVEYYIKLGYLPGAIINFVSLLGWNPGGNDMHNESQEVLSMDDLIKKFSLKRVQKGGAVVNLNKLDWFQQKHIKLHITKHFDQVMDKIKQDFPKKYETMIVDFNQFSTDYMKRVLNLLKDHITFEHELIPMIRPFVTEPNYLGKQAKLFKEKILPTHSNEIIVKTLSSIQLTLEKLTETENWIHAVIYQQLKLTADEMKLSQKEIFSILRFILTGTETGPSLPAIIEIMGKDRVFERIQKNIQFFNNRSSNNGKEEKETSEIDNIKNNSSATVTAATAQL